MPSSVREDAVLPDGIRRQLGDAVFLVPPIAVSEQQRDALHQIVLGTTERGVVLSVARMDAERRYREPSGAMLEAAAAIGRPPLGVCTEVTIPDGNLLREHSFEPAREELESGPRALASVHANGQLDRAVRRREVPPRLDQRITWWPSTSCSSLETEAPARWTAGSTVTFLHYQVALLRICRSLPRHCRGCSNARTVSSTSECLAGNCAT